MEKLKLTGWSEARTPTTKSSAVDDTSHPVQLTSWNFN